MIEITTTRISAGISLAWSLFWILVFDRWFLLSPLGLIIAFGIPIAGWVLWWKFYRNDEQKMVADGRLFLGKSAEIILKLKNQFSGNH